MRRRKGWKIRDLRKQNRMGYTFVNGRGSALRWPVRVRRRVLTVKLSNLHHVGVPDG